MNDPVKRYKSCQGMVEDVSGKFVLCADYDALATEAAQLRERVAEADTVTLHHVAVAEGGNLRWMAGRKVPDCELYAVDGWGRAPDLMTVAQHHEITARLRAQVEMRELAIVAADQVTNAAIKALRAELDRANGFLSRAASSYKALLADCGLGHRDLLDSIDAHLSERKP